MPTYGPNPFVDARLQAWHRQIGTDPATYTQPLEVRQDAKFTLMGIMNELGLIIDTESVGRRVHVKNTTGLSWGAGRLLKCETLKLTPQTAATSTTASITRGATKLLLVAATFEVGQLVTVVSNGRTDTCLVTAVSAGVSVTVDFLFSDHNLPVVTALPAYEASLADADGANPAEWTNREIIADGAYGFAYDMVEVPNVDTSLFVIEDLLFLSGTAGDWTKVAPTGADQVQQVVGYVKKVDATLGIVLLFPGMKRFLKYGSSMLQAAVFSDLNNIMTGRTYDLNRGKITEPLAKGAVKGFNLSLDAIMTIRTFQL